MKCRIELSFILLFRYFRQLRADKLQKLANMAAEKAGKAAPILVKIRQRNDIFIACCKQL
jgi:hypothetical protein